MGWNLKGSDSSFLRAVPVVIVASLIFSGIALCGVAATEGAEFSVESVGATPTTDSQESTVTTVSGAGAKSVSAPLGLAASPPDVGIDLSDSTANAPLGAGSGSEAAQTLITTPDVGEASGAALDLPDGADVGDANPETDDVASQPGSSDASDTLGQFAESGVVPSQSEIEPDPSADLIDPESDRQPFAAVGGITLYGPADTIRAAGFHESANTQALEMRELDSSLETMVMDSRGRGTGRHTAADMAVSPDETIYSPVTGTVVDARAYKLYCKYDDNVVIIEPDAAPDRQVKVLHISNLLIKNGDRVVAGKTPIASGPTPLPFSSQIDSYVENSTNTHVHIETVDLDLVDATNSTVCP